MTEKFRVVAVDDDQDVLDLIELTLGADFEVVTLKDSSEACDLIDICEPDAVVADIMMPGVTGYRIVEYMKESPHHQHAVAVFLSAKNTPRDIKYGYKVGANLYLTKPFQPERLSRALHALLSEGSGVPRRKALTFRDIQLRLKYRLGIHAPGSRPRPGGEVNFPLPPMPDPEVQLHPPAPDEDVDPGDKNWVG